MIEVELRPVPRSMEWLFLRWKVLLRSKTVSILEAMCGDVEVSEVELVVYGGLDEAAALGSR